MLRTLMMTAALLSALSTTTFAANPSTRDLAAEEANRIVREEGIPFRDAYRRVAERFAK